MCRNGANTPTSPAKSGHGGGDFWTTFHFAEAIRTGKPPFLDVYRGVAMSSVGILAWKSALPDGPPLTCPISKRDPTEAFRERQLVALAGARGPGQPPASILGRLKPSKKDLAFARKVWRSVGYTGK